MIVGVASNTVQEGDIAYISLNRSPNAGTTSTISLRIDTFSGSAEGKYYDYNTCMSVL